MNITGIQNRYNTPWSSPVSLNESLGKADFAALARETERLYNSGKSGVAQSNLSEKTFPQTKSAQALYTNYIERYLYSRQQNQKLIDEQIAYLKEKYDVENMSQDEFNKLLEELKNLNIISESEFKNQLGHPIPPAKFVITSSDERYDELLGKKDERNYLKRLETEQKQFEYLMNAIHSGNYSTDSDSDPEALRKFYETQAEYSKNMADIFSQLKRG